MGLSLNGLVRTAVGISPYALSAVRQTQADNERQDAINNAEDDRLRSNFFKGQANDRANAQETSEEALRAAQVANLGSDSEWENPVAVTGPDNQPILVQRNKRTGDLRPAVIGGPGAGPAQPPGVPGVQTTPSVAMGGPVAARLPGAMQSLAAKMATSTAPNPATSAPSPAPLTAAVTKGPTPLRPYVKPPVTAIPYTLTPAGMQADSTLHAKNAQAEAPYKKDPNAAPSPTYTPVTVANPDGTVTVKPFNTKTGEAGPSIGGPKPTAASGGSASLSPDDRNRMMAQARLDNQTMKDYEAKVLSGQASVGTTAGVAGALSDAHDGTVGKVTGILANRVTGAIDPDYQKYITAQRSYGRIMGNLQSKRYTDNQAEIERSISGMQGNDLPGTIRYKQQMRDASLADVATTPNAAAASNGRGGVPPTGARGNTDLRTPAKGNTTVINGKTYVLPP
jgi:hypothetical protein